MSKIININLSNHNISRPLREHPRHRPRRNQQREHESPSQLRAAIAEPLGDKMAKRDPVRPQRKVIRDRRSDMVGGVHAHDGRQEGPGAEGARRQRVGGRLVVGRRGAGVQLVGVVEGAVGLEAVDAGDDGDLGREIEVRCGSHIIHQLK